MSKTININNKKEVIILDQRLLPFKVKYIRTKDYKTVIKAIKNLSVRGAPAIGVAGAFAAYLASEKFKTLNNIDKLLEKKLNEIILARPTAVNLQWAVKRFLKILKNKEFKSLLDLKGKFLKESKKIYNEEKNVSELISKNGSRLIKNNDNILTHCNTGALATTGIGTAFGIINKSNKIKKNINLFATETRPLNQGSRLTTWEARRNNIKCFLITDSMAAHIIKTEKINIIIVGADRIASNGDTANKIGTYQLAISALYHQIPFYVAAPLSTFDLDTKNGQEIVIEERSSNEIIFLNNEKITNHKNVKNPAFDITPSNLITGIITEKGIIYKPNKSKIKKILS